MRIRPTIIAAVLACGSAGAAWFAWRQEHEGAASEVTGPRRLFVRNEIPIDNVEHIALARHEEREMVFERRAGEWMQTAPVQYPVDLFSMRQLIIAVHDLVMIGEPLEAAGESLESMGLDPPRAVISLQWPGGARVLRLGRTGVGGMAYLQVEGDSRVHLVRRGLHDRAVQQSPFEWRRKHLFDDAGIDSTELVVEGIGAGSYTIEREGPRWVMTAPVQARLDSSAVEEHLSVLGAVQASSFITDLPEDLSQYGLNPPRAAATVTTAIRIATSEGAREERSTERLLIGTPRALDQGESYFAMMEGRDVVFAIPRGAVERLAASGHLIDLRALAVNPADVRSIRISGNDEEFTLVRDRDDPTKWLVDDAAATPVQAAMIDALFGVLTVARAENAEVRDFPFDQRVGHIALYDFSGDPLGAVQAARLDDGRWALFSDDHVLRIFPATASIAFSLQQYLEQ